MVKQWPFDMVGSNTLTSALAYDREGRKYMVDLVPFFKRLADLLCDRDGKTDDADFWTDFQKHLNLPYIHNSNSRHVKKVLSEHWRHLHGSPFPKPPVEASLPGDFPVFEINEVDDEGDVIMSQDSQDSFVTVCCVSVRFSWFARVAFVLVLLLCFHGNTQ